MASAGSSMDSSPDLLTGECLNYGKMLFIKIKPPRNRCKPCLELSHSYEIILILRITGICLELLL